MNPDKALIGKGLKVKLNWLNDLLKGFIMVNLYTTNKVQPPMPLLCKDSGNTECGCAYTSSCLTK